MDSNRQTVVYIAVGMSKNEGRTMINSPFIPFCFQNISNALSSESKLNADGVPSRKFPCGLPNVFPMPTCQ
jgi:hypothetical protein